MKQSSKRLFAVLLAVCMLAGLVPTAALAADPATVTTAEQLDAAIEAGGTIKLGADLTGDSAVKRGKGEARTVPPILTISKDVVLDLNGHTLELKSGDRETVVVDGRTKTVDNRNTFGIQLTNGASLTVMDSSKDADGLLTTDCYYLLGVDYDDDVGETFTLESGTLEITSRWGNIISALDPLFTVVVTGGTMVENGFRSNLIFNQGKTRISGGTFISTDTIPRPDDVEERYGEDKVGGLTISRPDFRITGGLFNCMLNIDAKGNGKVTGGYFIDGAFGSEDDTNDIFYNSGYSLVETSQAVDGDLANTYPWKAAKTGEEQIAYSAGMLFVGGKQLAPASDPDTEENQEIKDDEGTVVASYDEATHTLTLNDYTYNGNCTFHDRMIYSGGLYDVSAGIYYKGGIDNEELTIVLEGDNTITMTKPDDSERYIYDLSAAVCIAGANLTILGGENGGSLTATGWSGAAKLAESAGIFVEEDDTEYDSYTEYGGNLTIRDCIVSATGGSATGTGWYEKGESEGIFAENDAVIENAVVTAEAGFANRDSIGLDIEGNATIKDSIVTASADGAIDNSYGIYVYRTVAIENSEITGTSADSSRYSDGIFFDSATSISDSTVTGISGKGGASAAGIYADAELRIISSTVTGTSANGKEGKNHGIHAKYSMLVSDGSEVTGTAGDSSNNNSYGVNVDGVLKIDGKSTVTGTAGESKSESGVSCGADIDSILSISKGSSLTGIGDAAKTSIGVRCGLVASDVTTPEASDMFVHFYSNDYVVPEGCSQTLAGAIVARAAESNADTSYGMVMLPYIGDVEMVLSDEDLEYAQEDYEECLEWWEERGIEPQSFLEFLQDYWYYGVNLHQVGDTYVYSTQGFTENDALNVTGSLLAQGANGGLQYAELKGDANITYIWNSAGEVASDDYSPVAVTAYNILAGEQYDGSDKKSKGDEFLTNAAYQYVETRNAPTPSGGGGGGGSSVQAFDVSVDSKVSGGSITADRQSVGVGTRVTFTVTPDQGSTVESVTVTDQKGNAVPVTKEGDGLYSFIMPKSAVTISATFRNNGQPVPTPADYASCKKDRTCPISKFSDAKPDAWYHDGVHYVLDEGIMQGVTQNTFCPGDSATRAMVVTMLWRLEDEPAVQSAGFADVSAGSWYEGAVNWAAANDIVKGYDAKTFGPGDPVTREQLASILYRYAQHKGVDVSVGESTNILSFDDVSTLSQWAYPAMQWAVGAQIIQGKGSESILAPKDSATRAEIATMFMRFLETAEV